MIDILQGLTWLNREKTTEIPDTTRFWIERIADPGVSDDDRKDIIDNLVRSVGRARRASEQAEILVNCSAYGYELNLVDEAVIWLQLAASLYEHTHDTHRQAVTFWMLYIVQRAIGQYQRAFDQARKARRLFSDLASHHMVREQIADESWYRARILDMTCDLVSSPEDVFEWMFEFHGTRLCASSAQIKSKLVEYLERREFDRAVQTMQLLLGVSLRSSDPLETGEALAYCGVVNWVLENRTEAIQFFRSAMTLFIPASHEHALVRWMLSLALFATPAERFNAITNMETSIDHFDCLRQSATYQNHMNERDWYALHHIAMKRVLRTKISGAI
jgi:hypothetical protein